MPSVKGQQRRTNPFEFFRSIGRKRLGIPCGKLGIVVIRVRQVFQYLQTAASVGGEVLRVLRGNRLDFSTGTRRREERCDEKVAKDVDRLLGVLCNDLEFVVGPVHRSAGIRSAAVGGQVSLVLVLSRVLLGAKEAHVFAEMSQSAQFSGIGGCPNVYNARHGSRLAFLVVDHETRYAIVEPECLVIPPIGLPLDGCGQRCFLDSRHWLLRMHNSGLDSPAPASC
mmetsp:Transcript_7949/g.23465  ORF Transcript_7949/g.23465 Transcript_7949/m.23465 type:complete len:225 (-) Transcript_7949:102-776(-)